MTNPSPSTAYRPTHGGYPGTIEEQQESKDEPAGPLGLIVWPDGRKSYQRLPDAEGNAQDEALRSIVGGWIEYVYVAPGVHLYCNEEGKLGGLPVNVEATQLAGLFPLDLLCGTVIFLGDADEGMEGDLPPEWQNLT